MWVSERLDGINFVTITSYVLFFKLSAIQITYLIEFRVSSNEK